MSRSYAMSMRSPHQALGLPVPVGRKLEVAAKRTWLVVMAGLTLFFVGTYLFQVNKAASKSYTLRSLEHQREELESTVARLENQSASIQSLANVEERVRGMGYVAVERMEFADVPSNAYALAK